MNVRSLILIPSLVFGTALIASSQTYTETTTRVEKPVIIRGEVVRLEPGRTIIIRSGEDEVSYVLAPGVTIPEEVQVGRTVRLRTELTPDGSTLVREISTTTVSDEGQVKRTTEVTRTRPSGDTTTTTTTTTGAATGQVVALEPGRTIVLRSDGREVTYVLRPEVEIPAEIEVGRSATVQFEPGPDGTSTVKRVTTTSVDPEGQVRRTTETTRTDPYGRTTRTTTTTTQSGKVAAYSPGRSITVTDAKGYRTTYTLSPRATVAPEVVVGKDVTVYAPPSDPGAQITYEIERDGDKIKIKAKSKRD
jgi:hypothetical protein